MLHGIDVITAKKRLTKGEQRINIGKMIERLVSCQAGRPKAYFSFRKYLEFCKKNND